MNNYQRNIETQINSISFFNVAPHLTILLLLLALYMNFQISKI